jgi:hypothetical protein
MRPPLNDLQRPARGQRSGLYSRRRPAPRWRRSRRFLGWSATPSAAAAQAARSGSGPGAAGSAAQTSRFCAVLCSSPSIRRRASAPAAAMRARDSAAPLRRAEAQSGPDQRREHHACGGPPPASPKPRRASGASRASRAAVEREFGRLKHEWSRLPLRVRGFESVQLHADLTIRAKLASPSQGREPYRSLRRPLLNEDWPRRNPVRL